MQIPDWIDLGAWNGFVEMRKSIKRPMTVRATELLIHRLEDFKKKGHDPNACLDQSTFHDWQNVYPIKAEDVPNLIPVEKYREPERTPEQRAADIAARDAVMAKLNLRRVA